jgi:4-hydroxybenzoate polyprenyltransferase
MVDYKRKRLLFVLFAFLRLIRIGNLLIMAFTQYLTAVFLIGPKSDWVKFLKNPELFLLVFSSCMIAGAGYIINDYYDVKIDAINKPHKMVIDRIIRRREAILLHFLFSFFGILMATVVSFKIGFVTLLAAVLLWYYSNDMKRRAFSGNLAVAALTGLAVIVVALLYHQNYFLVSVYAIFSIIISIIREIIKDMEDLKGDQTFGCKTLPIILGVRKTKLIVYAFAFILVIYNFYVAYELNSNVFKGLAYFLTLFAALFSYYLYQADTKKSYSELSFSCKIILLFGVLSMIWV